MSPVVSIENLRKSYGEFQAVGGVSLFVNPGEIVGLLGPNGAGKTSTLECTIGLRQPDSGNVKICGIDASQHPAQVKQMIGAQLQATALQDKITPREAIGLFASFYEKPASPTDLIKRFSLEEKADNTFDSLSGGQKQRLALALAFVNQPKAIFLDEPTTGLDPQSRRELHQLILQMKQEEKAILLTTHYIEEAQQLCDRIAIIDHGQIIATGTPAELMSKGKSLSRVSLILSRPLDIKLIEALPNTTEVIWSGIEGQFKSSRVGVTMIELIKLIDAQQNELVDLRISRPSLEDVFIELTGSKLRD